MAALEEIAFDDPGVKATERMKALELLGKHLGMWKDAPGPDPGEGELAGLRELLEQRKRRRDG